MFQSIFLVTIFVGIFYTFGGVESKSAALAIEESSSSLIFGLYCVSCEWTEGEEDTKCLTGPFNIFDLKLCKKPESMFNGCICAQLSSTYNGKRYVRRYPYIYQYGQSEGCFRYPDLTYPGSPTETDRVNCYCRGKNGCNGMEFPEKPDPLIF